MRLTFTIYRFVAVPFQSYPPRPAADIVDPKKTDEKNGKNAFTSILFTYLVPECVMFIHDLYYTRCLK